jgi:nicotinamidase-related amidase
VSTPRCGRRTTAVYECVVVADCVGAYFPEFHDAGLRMIKAQGGIFGWIASSAAVIAALSANSPEGTP